MRAIEAHRLTLPPPSRAETLPARVHETLEQAIIDGRLAPESRLHADVLAAHFGISRIPVREAMRSLHEAGWVEIRPRYGVHVRSRDRSEMLELFECRAEVERSVARFAARRRDDDDLARFADIVAAGRSARDAGDTAALDANGLRLYAALRGAAKNSELAALSISLEKRARFYYVSIAAELGLAWTFVHERLAGLVADRDAGSAGELIVDHIVDTGRRTAELLFGRSSDGGPSVGDV